jgi:hypothetical protein
MGTVTGTVSGTLYINIDITGPAVQSVGPLTISGGSNSGTAAIIPRDPWSLGVGTFTSRLTVHACQGDQTCKTGELKGSPQVVDVTYTIGSALGNALIVNPWTVASGISGDVVVRSIGWGAIAPPTGLTVGSSAALSFTHPDATTYTVTYPALSAGSYPIKTNNGDLIGTVNVVDIPAFTATSLTYPSPPASISDVFYYTNEQALIVTTRNTDSSTNQLLSYSYANGSWSAPVAQTVPKLRHALPIVSNWFIPAYGLMLVNEDSISYYHTAGTPFPNNFSPEVFSGAGLSNTGNYLLTLETPGTSSMQFAMFGGPGSVVWPEGTPNIATAGAFPQPTMAASDDGSRIIVLGASGAATKIGSYDAAHELMSDTSVAFNHNGTGRAPALDRRATRIVVSNDTATNVYDSNLNLLGTLPSSTQAYVVNSKGTRVYTYDGTPQILTFDVSSTANGGAYAPTGTPIAVAAAGTNPRMNISQDDHTVFVAGATQIIVQPVP